MTDNTSSDLREDHKRLFTKTFSVPKDISKTFNSAINSSVSLFNSNNIDQLRWPNTEKGRLAKEYFTALIKNGTSTYIDNIHANVVIAQIDTMTIPLLIATDNYNDAYVCSEYGHYVLLALESLFVVENTFLRKLAAWLLKGMGATIRKGKINNVIYVNHSLFATDLQNDSMTNEQITTLTDLLKAKYPHHAIIFRGINDFCCPQLAQKLTAHKYKFVAERQVQITDTSNPELFETRIIKSDMRFWKNHPYVIEALQQFSSEEETRILDLYNTLAIENHSKLNPWINTNYIKLLQKRENFEIKVIRKQGVIEGVVGYERQGNTFTCLLFGYDKKAPEATDVYRAMSISLMLEATKNKSIFHQSSGATFYKQIRRAKSLTEYQAVWTEHLPLKQKAAWILLRCIMNTVAIPLMKKY